MAGKFVPFAKKGAKGKAVRDNPKDTPKQEAAQRKRGVKT